MVQDSGRFKVDRRGFRLGLACFGDSGALGLYLGV